MRNLFSVTIAIFCLTVFYTPAQAAKLIKSNKASKERLVLMPLRVSDEDKNLLGAMETALVEGLQLKYEVFSGEQVVKKSREIFLKESRIVAKKECDETRCMQDIAEAFQAELIATSQVTKRDGGYFLALSVQNIFDNKVVYSKSVPCESCNTFDVVDKLKELSGNVAQAIPQASSGSTSEQPTLAMNNLPVDLDTVLWNEAQKGNTAEDYQVYLESFPKGKYNQFAKTRIKKIKESDDLRQQQAWSNAKQENNLASYSLYLNTYPNGRFAGFAKVRIDKLKFDQVARDEEDLWSKADSNGNKAALETYINRYPAGRYIAEANTKLKLVKDSEVKWPVMIRISDKDYEIGKYEVTQAEWREVMGNSPSYFGNCGKNCPVEQVSWEEIQAFIRKLNDKTGKQYRLPTEAEWEYACYGGSQTEYCGDSNIDAVAWTRGNSNSTHPVGQKQSNAYGLLDMSGNVYEWMSNCMDGDCAVRVLRGGAWNSEPLRARAGYRISLKSSGKDYDVGFRLARTLP